MAQTVYSSLANYVVHPTENDHYGSEAAGTGRCLQEVRLCPALHYMLGHSGIVKSGFAMPGAASGLTHDVTAGEAVLEGYHILGTDDESVTFTDSATNWVWLQLIYDGNDKVVRPQLYIDTGASRPTPPANGMLLGSVVCSGGNISTSHDYRTQGKIAYGSVDASGSIDDYGSGDWSVSYGSTYTITFDSAFLRLPNIMATLAGTAGGNLNTVGVGLTTTTARVSVYNATPALTGADFTFWAFL